MAGLLGTQRFPTSATGKLPFSRPLSRSNPALLFFTIYLACAGSRNLISSRHGGTLGNPAVPNLRDGETPVFPTPFPFKSCFIVFHYIFSLCWEQESHIVPPWRDPWEPSGSQPPRRGNSRFPDPFPVQILLYCFSLYI